jgi:UDP:flavonoid glycosyltransferase YjiC (YdhE family)
LSSRPGPARVLVVTWAPGGNLPPLLAAATLMAARGHAVEVLASAATRGAVERAGLPLRSYRRTPEPDTRIAFERQAGAMLATAAGADVAHDVHDVLEATRPDLVIVDCMLPAALSAADAAGTPAAALVHFLYGLARREMLLRDSGWTTDVEQLNTTRRDLGLPAVTKGLEAWEAPDLVLVTAPRWLDVDLEYPAHVIHAGPLGIRTGGSEQRGERPRVLLSFSTTVMDGQSQAVQRICDGVAGTAVDAVLTLGPAVEEAALQLPSNVTAAAWADHDELLPGCSAVISHGGLGTTLRALAHGVPLLLLPLGRDQAFNAARVVEYGAGLQLTPDAGPAAVGSAMARLLDEPGFAAAAARAAARIVADMPDQRAVEALEARAVGRSR